MHARPEQPSRGPSGNLPGTSKDASKDLPRIPRQGLSAFRCPRCDEALASGNWRGPLEHPETRIVAGREVGSGGSWMSPPLRRDPSRPGRIRPDQEALRCDPPEQGGDRASPHHRSARREGGRRAAGQAWGLLNRILRGLYRLVKEPYYMFPVGVLFGLGFDTATEVLLIGISVTIGVSTTIPPG
jgi:hypothetical protein